MMIKASQKEIETEKGRGIRQAAGSLKQFTTLTRRSFTNISRDFTYYRLRIVVYIILSMCVGIVIYDVGTNYHAILARGACGGFISSFMTFMSIGGFPCFIEEMKVNNITLPMNNFNFSYFSHVIFIHVYS